MTRREIVLTKLQELSDAEINLAIRQLTYYVKARLRYKSLWDRTKTGAHGEKNLGMHAIDYYVGESIRRLYSPTGWDWKFEERSIDEQLKRIANKLISDVVDKYKKTKEDVPQFDQRDVSEIKEIENDADCIEDEEANSKLIQLAHKLSQDDDNLCYFTRRYFEGADYDQISLELEITVETVYALRKKLVRRLMRHKNELTV